MSDFSAQAMNLAREFLAVFPIIFTIESARYFAAAGLVSLIVFTFWRPHFEKRKIQTRRRARPADYRREILASVRTFTLFSFVGFGMYLGAKAGVLIIYDDFSARGAGYFAATLIAMILAHDAYFYWTHRAMHHRWLFRVFHRTHHKSRTPTPWTAYAFDAPEALTMAAFVPLWTAFVPMHDLALVAFMSWQILRNAIGHAGAEMSPVSGRPSRWFGWLTTTTHHDLHHQDARYNYGLYFSWWDRWMRTEHPDYQARVAAIAARSAEARAPARRGAALIALTAALTGALVAADDAQAQSGALNVGSEKILGVWATQGFGSIVQFAPCADDANTICGRIVWLWEPHDQRGEPRRDSKNPDADLRARGLAGIQIVTGLREAEPGVWRGGRVYNPDDGRIYSGSIRLVDGTLRLKGCALRAFCQTQTWRRPSDVFAAIKAFDGEPAPGAGAARANQR